MTQKLNKSSALYNFRSYDPTFLPPPAAAPRPRPAQQPPPATPRARPRPLDTAAELESFKDCLEFRETPKNSHLETAARPRHCSAWCRLGAWRGCGQQPGQPAAHMVWILSRWSRYIGEIETPFTTILPSKWSLLHTAISNYVREQI